MASRTGTEPELLDQLRQFYRYYYQDEIGRLAESYPDRKHITIEWPDLYQYSPDLAEDLLTEYDHIHNHMQEAVREYDTPIDVELDGVDVRVVGLHEQDVQTPIGLVKQKDPGYIAVDGELAKVTTPEKELQEVAFECQRCGTLTYIPQSGSGLQEPHECQGCERQGPFKILYSNSTFDHYCKIRIQTPPDETGELQNEFIDGHVRGDLVWEGHDEYGIVARSGDPVRAYGTLQRERKDGDGRLFEEALNVKAIEFTGESKDVDIEANRDEFTKVAQTGDPVASFAESIAPELYATPAWERALELLVAYLFGAPRIDIEDGPSFRGDIHVLIISDYGMGKSMVNEAVALFSPKVIKESITGMSSDVGLLAAAVKDDFGEEQWTLEPGILVRANGGHVILDEIDKTDVDLERMNNALEGEQVVDVNKAGQQATYKSRVGLLATGNPAQARFNPHEAISDQLDIDQSLLSRFDGIVTMSDNPDEEVDMKIAETQGLSYVEAQEYEYGDREELDKLDREVSPDVGRAWIAYARENVHPLVEESHIEEIKEWYANEVRQLNDKFADNESEGGDMPVPATARVVAGTIRFSVAFARVHLRDEVTEDDVDRAMDLMKSLIGQNFDGSKFHPQIMRGAEGDDTRKRVLDALDDKGWMYPSDISLEAGVSEETVRDRLDKLYNKTNPPAVEQKNGKWRRA